MKNEDPYLERHFRLGEDDFPQGARGRGVFSASIISRSCFCASSSIFTVEPESRLAKSAFVIDIREREFFEEGKDVLRKIKKKYGAELIFLESSDEMLFRRFKETRRSHPFYDVSNIKEALDKEREQVGWIKEISDKVIDTSLFTTNGLRNFVISTYGDGEKRMKINLVSFGFAYGIPLEADIVQDVRFLPNPFFVEGLKEKTGLVARRGGIHEVERGLQQIFPDAPRFLREPRSAFRAGRKELSHYLHRMHGGKTPVAGGRERAGRAPAHDGL